MPHTHVLPATLDVLSLLHSRPEPSLPPLLFSPISPPPSLLRYNLTEAVGSWAYMAPEVVLGQPYNEKVDVFSFGVIVSGGGHGGRGEGSGTGERRASRVFKVWVGGQPYNEKVCVFSLGSS